MPVNRAFVGREYPGSTTYEVGREHVRSFAEAIGESNPVCLDMAAARAAGYRDVVAPPTFLTVLDLRFGDEGPLHDPELGLDFSLVVHGSQEFELHREVCAGDVLTSVQRVETIRDAGANELVVTVTEVHDLSGQPVATLRSTIISRGTAPDAGD